VACSDKDSADDDSKEGKGTLHFKNISCEGDGPTCDIGLPYNKGIVDYVRETNKTNGFGGYKIELDTFNGNYDHAVNEKKIESWRKDEEYADVLGYFLWCTPEATYLHTIAEKDKKLSIPCSYAGHLATPVDVKYENTAGKGEAPGGAYTFFAGTDYSTTIRAGVQFMKDKGAKRAAFFYCEQTDFCYGPIPAGKDYAAEVGLEVAPDYRAHVAEFASYTADIKKYVKDNPDVDWVWCGNATTSCAELNKALVAAGSKAKMVLNTYGLDERTAETCKEDCTDVKNVYGILPFTPFGDLTVPGMEDVVAYHEAGRIADGEDEDEHANVRYVQGHVSGLMIKLAIDKLDGDEVPTGENIKKALETFRNQSTAELTEPLSFNKDDHRPTSTARVYSINTKGKLQFEVNVDVELKREWLGW
jgi:branched-chain amino acid transport system substrate-binding protein